MSLNFGYPASRVLPARGNASRSSAPSGELTSAGQSPSTRTCSGFTFSRRVVTAPGWGPTRAPAPLVELHERPGARPVPRRGLLGLFHFAILLPDRAALGRFVGHLAGKSVAAGSANHWVSESLYLSDPERTRYLRSMPIDRAPPGARTAASWPWRRTRSIPGSLVNEAAGEPWRGMPPGTVMGHVHLSRRGPGRSGGVLPHRSRIQQNGVELSPGRSSWRSPGTAVFSFPSPSDLTSPWALSTAFRASVILAAASEASLTRAATFLASLSLAAVAARRYSLACAIQVVVVRSLASSDCRIGPEDKRVDGGLVRAQRLQGKGADADQNQDQECRRELYFPGQPDIFDPAEHIDPSMRRSSWRLSRVSELVDAAADCGVVQLLAADLRFGSTFLLTGLTNL